VGLIETIKNYSEEVSISSDKKEELNFFLNEGFPTIKDEEWRYTSLKTLFLKIILLKLSKVYFR